MNDSELNRILRSAPVPEPPPDYWHEFPGTIVRRLRQGHGSPAPDREGRRVLRRWGLGFAAACLVVGFAIGLWRAARPFEEGGLIGPNLALLREVTAMFPNSVRAIVADGSSVRLVLSDRADVPVSDPLWIRVCEGKQCQTVITFSGQTVELAGSAFEALADARGHVLLVGGRGVWSSESGGRMLAGRRVEARVLDMVL